MDILLPMVLAAANTATPAPSVNPTTLPDVNITAATEPVKGLTQPSASAARDKLSTVPGGTQVIETSTFSEGRVSTLSDALGLAAGVFIQPRFGAEESRLSIRGSGIQRTFHGRGIRLLQDGIPVNLADGSFDFQVTEPLATQYIEVLRGANGFGYGAANLGGVVNYMSETGLTAPKASARIEAGSYGYLRLQAQGAFNTGTTDGYATITQYQQNGFREHARQDSAKGIANLGFQINPDIETRFFVTSVRSNSDLPGNLTYQQLRDNPRQANATSLRLDQKRDFDIDRLSNRTVMRVGGGLLDMSAYGSFKKLFHPITPWIEQDNKDWGAAVRYSVDTTVFGTPSTVNTGISPYKGITRQKQFARASAPVAGLVKGAQTDDSVQTADGYDTFAELQTHWTSQWTSIAGLQYSKSTRKVDDLLPTVGTPPDASYARNFSRYSPRVGALYRASPTMTLYGNLSGSFEPPSFSELGANSTPTANNRAQRATTLELGTRGQQAGYDWDVAVYYARVKDELLTLNTDVPNVTATINANNTRHLGIEAAFAKDWGQGWSSRHSALLNRFEFDGDPVFGNNKLAGLPTASVRSTLQKAISPTLRVAVSLEAANPTPVDMANTLYAPGYGIVGARLSGDYDRTVSWFVDLRNLANRRYAATTGVINNAGGTDQAQFLPGDGRSAYTGLTVRF